MSSRSRAGLVWKFQQWPADDRAAWVRGCAPSDPFEDYRYASALKGPSLDFTAQGYGRWLAFLDAQGWLDPSEAPFRRVTRRRLKAYFQDLRRLDNADWTIIGRFAALQRALKIISPGVDVSWIRKPMGISIYAALSRPQRYLLVPSATVLFNWGLGMMDEAEPKAGSKRWLTSYRDGLLIAMLASRGRRLRSMVSVRVGVELTRAATCYRIELTSEQVKTKRADSFSLPARLTPYMDRYLHEVRPILLDSLAHKELWITRQGNPAAPHVIQTRIQRLSFKRFGTAFGPHRFRHAISTEAALSDPGSPGLAAGLLGVSAGVIEQNYARAGQVTAAITFAGIMDRKIRQFGQP